jgi:membrane-associated protein
MRLLHWILDLLRDPGPFIKWAGYPGMAIVIFAETGLMTFFLPGDSLLVVAGLYAAKGDLSLLAINALLIPMAILGMVSSYQIGKTVGPPLFSRPQSRFFKPKHLETAKGFYEKWGPAAIFIARFSPIVRTFVPVVAGVARMDYRRYTAYNIAGAVAWIGSMTLIGFFFGRQFPSLANNIDKVIVVVVVLSMLPIVFHAWRARKGTKGS